MSDQEWGDEHLGSRFARHAPPPEMPSGVATPAGSPFADHSGTEAAAPRRGGRSSVNGTLTHTLQVAALVWAITNVGAAALALRALQGFEDWLDADADVSAWYDAHDAMNTAMNVSYGVGLALFVGFVVWSYQLTRSTSRHGVTDRRWTPGWALGSWFVPLANLLLPLLVFRENERIAETAANGRPKMWVHARPRVTSLLGWIFVVAGTIMASVGTTWTGINDTFQSDFSEARRGYVFVAVGLAAAGIGSALLALAVGRVTRFDHTRSN
ncbi:MAG: DUF4328 domain-containing protein [Actinomycetota bacterium]|nr:DUF4328 domain-containing protein [Actinomycetota bacterium]